MPDVRNRDLPDLLVNTQRATDPAVPADASSLQRYLGLEDALTFTATSVTLLVCVNPSTTLYPSTTFYPC